MKQISFRLKKPEDLDFCLASFRDQCPKNPSAILITVFSGWQNDEALQALLYRIHKAIPYAIVVGSTIAVGIFAGRLALHQVLLNFMVFEKAHIEAFSFDFTKTSPNNAIKPLLLASQKNLSGIALLIAGNNKHTYDFLSHINALSHDIPIFGGIAEADSIPAQVFSPHSSIHQGVIAVCFEGRNLHVRVDASTGWNPLGPRFRVTAIENDNCLSLLDHKPAIHIYEKYLTISSEEFAKENMAFPLSIERNGQEVLRLPSTVTHDGGIHLHGDCRLHETVRLAYGSPGEILEALSRIQKNIIHFVPDAIFLFDCSSRRFFLRDTPHQELQPFHAIAPCIGFYTAGEVGREKNENVFLRNMTLVAVSFREGDIVEARRQAMPSYLPSVDLTGTAKLIQYLTHFISVASSELESANRRLTELATHDALTHVYNRGAIEVILKEKFARNRPLCAIMLDIDNFKTINDTFGHATGDQVLQWVGKKLMESVSPNDAIGRWGGEEFLIVLDECSLKDGVERAETIRCHVNGYSLPNGTLMSASFGVASRETDVSYMDFYRSLDAALYRAKHTGKNRVVKAEGFKDELQGKSKETQKSL